MCPKIKYIVTDVCAVMSDRIPFIMSMIIVAVSLLLGIWKGDGSTVGVCVVAMLIAVPAMIFCPRSVSVYSIIASLVLLACTVFMILFVPYEALIGTEAPGSIWMYISAIILGIALIPQVLMFFFTVAAMFNASYNWAIVASLGWLVGVGMTVPKYLFVLALHYEDVHQDLMMNSTIVIPMLVNLIMFAAFFYAFGRKLRKDRLLITSDGLEAMR
jgi:hypothetical protein